ncbi:hypothetical protein RL2611 [Rhizobium johnstonii 3841]|uniref:Uncharacterized protein n=1 Tax=Rhizobium johnstonii (strain DSM 114642 / LMG 32736 / 3841) TaxID=216596 RepID=Q1MG24_RHIJ3|nr:hypothetical protein RL2611 [Rhizobium johnstonii 3841]
MRLELREKKEIEHLRDSKKNGDALARFPLFNLCRDGARQENARRQQRAGNFFLTRKSGRCLEFAADLQTGACHAVVRPIAEIGMRGMGDLGDDVTVCVETIGRAQIFVEEDATAEFRARDHRPRDRRYE